MIDGITVKFGDGTIAVNSNFGVLRFIWIKPRQDIGANLKDAAYEGIRTLSFEYDNDMLKLRADLDRLAELNYIIFFRGYMLNFKNYNEASVRVIRKAVNNIILYLGPLYAA